MPGRDTTLRFTAMLPALHIVISFLDLILWLPRKLMPADVK
jgi:hypothetical protein